MPPLTICVAVDCFPVHGVTSRVENVHYLKISFQTEVAIYVKTTDEFGTQSEHNSKIKISEAIFLK